MWYEECEWKNVITRDAPHNILWAGDVPIVCKAEVVVRAEVEVFAYDPPVGRYVVVLPPIGSRWHAARRADSIVGRGPSWFCCHRAARRARHSKSLPSHAEARPTVWHPTTERRSPESAPSNPRSMPTIKSTAGAVLSVPVSPIVSSSGRWQRGIMAAPRHHFRRRRPWSGGDNAAMGLALGIIPRCVLLTNR